jgi:hypothetical protein
MGLHTVCFGLRVTAAYDFNCPTAPVTAGVTALALRLDKLSGIRG